MERQIWQQVRDQEAALHLQGGKRRETRFIWPLRLAEDTTLPGYYAIYQFVDHDPVFGQVLDYNCGHRTYDLENYNHAGTDIGLYPWAWRKLDEGTIAVVAAAPGIITGKDDGYYDRNCSWGNNQPANYVIITHSDGSRALYWHMKQGSITEKPIGSEVAAGEYLGKVASSGFSNIPHLHFEIQSSENKVIDPWAGPCNETTDASWWIDQKPYWDPAINEIDVHYEAPSPYSSCPNLEDTRIRRVYNPGSELFPAVYYRDQRLGDLTEHQLIQPDGTVYSSWNHNSPGDYLTSWWYWQMKLPDDAISGTWTYRVRYYEQVIDWNFEVSGACLPALSLLVEKPGIMDAGLFWSAHAERYLVHIYTDEGFNMDTMVDQPRWKVTGLAPDTKYNWSVTSICGQDSSITTQGPAFNTRPIIYFQAHNLLINPEQPYPDDSIQITITGILFNDNTKLQTFQFKQEKTDLFIEAGWTAAGGISTERDTSISLTLPPLEEGEYRVFLSGEHGDYAFLSAGFYPLYVSGCKEIPLYISPISDKSAIWDINDQAGIGQYIIRYRIMDEREYTYDTLTYPYCLFPPCPGIGTQHLEYRLGEWLIRDLQPCQNYEFEMYQPCLNGDGDFSKPQRIQMPCETLPCANVYNPVIDSVDMFGYSMHWQDSVNPTTNAYVVNLFVQDSLVWQDFLYSTLNNRHYRDHHVQGRYWVECLCENGSCLRPPLILPAPSFYTLDGLSPCTTYQVSVSQWCVDSLYPSEDTLEITTACPPDPYFTASHAIQVYEPQAAALDSLQIQDRAFGISCGNCTGCSTTGYQLLPDTIEVIGELSMFWKAWLPGTNKYMDDRSGQQISFGPGKIALYLDVDGDGEFEKMLYDETTKDLQGSLNVDLSTGLDPGRYRLRLVWSPLEDPVSRGFLHFGSVIDIPIHLTGSTSSREEAQFEHINYLNPVIDQIVLNHLPDQNVQVTIYNILGQQVSLPVYSNHQPNISMDASSYVRGVYFLQVSIPQERRVLTLIKL